MHQHADPPDVSLPAAQLLVQRGVADDFVSGERQQREVAAQVNILAPVANDFRFCDAMLDKHALLFRHGQKKVMKGLLIGRFERAQHGFETILQRDFLRIFLENGVQHSCSRFRAAGTLRLSPATRRQAQRGLACDRSPAMPKASVSALSSTDDGSRLQMEASSRIFSVLARLRSIWAK